MPAGWQHTEAGEHLAGRRTSSTKAEMTVRTALHRKGLRFRLGRQIEGFKPDLVFPGPRVAVFVDGCYWHACPQHGPKPIQGPNASLWAEKLAMNQARDARAVTTLTAAGWDVIRIWECSVRSDARTVADTVALLVTEARMRRSSSPAGAAQATRLPPG